MGELSNERVRELADEWGWKPQAVAFALGVCDENVADAKAYLAAVLDREDA